MPISPRRKKLHEKLLNVYFSTRCAKWTRKKEAAKENEFVILKGKSNFVFFFVHFDACAFKNNKHTFWLFSYRKFFDEMNSRTFYS